MAAFQTCDMMEVNNHLSTEPPRHRHHLTNVKVEESSSSASEKLLQIRQLVRSLIFDWNLGGESEIEGNK